MILSKDGLREYSHFKRYGDVPQNGLFFVLFCFVLFCFFARNSKTWVPFFMKNSGSDFYNFLGFAWENFENLVFRGKIAKSGYFFGKIPKYGYLILENYPWTWYGSWARAAGARHSPRPIQIWVGYPRGSTRAHLCLCNVKSILGRIA